MTGSRKGIETLVGPEERRIHSYIYLRFDSAYTRVGI